jgi:thiamine kinase-like enzyme
MPDIPDSSIQTRHFVKPVWVDIPSGRRFTPDWVTRAIGGYWPDARVKRVEMGPVHVGTTNHYRIYLSYHDANGPESLFIKAQSRLGHRLLVGMLGIITPETRLLGSGEDLPIESPLVYAVGIDRARLDSLILMEDLEARQAKPNHVVTAPITLAQVYKCIDQLAKLHGKYWNNVPASLNGVKPWRRNAGWDLLSLLSGCKGVPRLRKYGAIDMLPEEVRPWHKSLWLTHRAIALSQQGPQTLIHGDTHVGNTYTLPDGQMGFVDWQCVHIGCWARDIGYLIICALEVEERRKHEEELLKYYLDALARAGGTPPAWDQLWKAYRNQPAYGLVAWISTLAGDDYQPDTVNMRYIERFGAAYSDFETGKILDQNL